MNKGQLSPFQQINLVNPDRFVISIERDHDAESDRRFGGGNDNDENRKDLSGHRVRASGFLQVTRERDEVQIRGIQNQLNRHEDDDDVAPRKHAGHANDEKQGANDEKL